jgi:hypothetical protein
MHVPNKGTGVPVPRPDKDNVFHIWHLIRAVSFIREPKIMTFHEADGKPSITSLVFASPQSPHSRTEQVTTIGTV